MVPEHDLADEHPLARVLVRERAPATVERVQLRLVDGRDPVRVPHRGIGLDHLVQVLRLEERLRDVDAEAVDAAVEPEAQDLLEVGLHLLVVPVEVGLVGREEVEEPLAARLVERPRGAAEHGRPAVRRASVAAGAEDVARAVGMVGRARARSGTTDARATCGSGRCRRAREARARAPPRRARRSRRASRAAGRRRCSPRRRSRGRRRATGRRASARSRRRRGRAGTRDASGSRSGRRRRRRPSRRSCARRSGRRRPSATTRRGMDAHRSG